MIFVTVGSQKFPFDRLISKVDELAGSGVITQPVFAQTGHGTYQPKYILHTSFLDKVAYEEKIQEADTLICHAAAGVMISGLHNRKKIIAIPRLRRYGEHVDDHQRELAAELARRNFLLYLDDMGQLPQSLLEIEERSFDVYKSDPEKTVAFIRELLSK